MHAEPAISLRSYGGEVRHHRHAFHQFVLPLRGTMELDTHAGARRVDRATALLLPAGADHSFRVRGDNRFIVVDVGGDHRLCERAWREPAFPVSPTLQRQLALAANPADWSRSLRRHWTALLFDTLGAAGRPATDAGSHRFVAALARVQQDSAVSVTALAAAVGLSPARLHVLFRRHAGSTPGACIARARARYGARLLAIGDRPIADIALDCGFSEHSAFTRAFRREYGVSPSAWRRQYRTWPH